ncbi:MAG TPA: hypothetical protein VFG73_02165 [Rhodanobacteraceae bacterium]|nr:hypothetical protein [Rhodanobacteraceae bacterium]
MPEPLSPAERRDRALIAWCRVGSLLALALLVGLAMRAAFAAEPVCNPVLVTLHSYTQGTKTFDACLSPRQGTAISYSWIDGAYVLVVNVTSPDNVSGDGIFTNGFE